MVYLHRTDWLHHGPTWSLVVSLGLSDAQVSRLQAMAETDREALLQAIGDGVRLPAVLVDEAAA